VRSDLDNVIGDAVKAAAGARLQALGDELKEKIAARAAGPVADAEAAVGHLDDKVGGALAGQSDALDQLLAEAKKDLGKDVGKGLKLPF